MYDKVTLNIGGGFSIDHVFSSIEQQSYDYCNIPNF